MQENAPALNRKPETGNPKRITTYAGKRPSAEEWISGEYPEGGGKKGSGELERRESRSSAQEKEGTDLQNSNVRVGSSHRPIQRAGTRFVSLLRNVWCPDLSKKIMHAIIIHTHTNTHARPVRGAERKIGRTLTYQNERDKRQRH